MSAISWAGRPYEDGEVAAILEPEVRAWFLGRFSGFTPPQRYAVREIHEGKSVLISSPTGTGKTLSAFLASVNELVALSKRGDLEDRVYCVYVSPLKALNNDIEKNLQEPLDGIRGVFEAGGRDPPPIRVGVRTGDTPQHERSRMTRRPPHILITTPESLALMLSAPRMGAHLAHARWIIVDEVHALAESKRGVHLALSLERLSARVLGAGRPEPVRVGLSATVSPLERVAAFLVGDRDCLLVDVNEVKRLDLDVVYPLADAHTAPYARVDEALHAVLEDLIAAHRTTLVFANARATTERLVHGLRERKRFREEGPEALDASPAGVPEDAEDVELPASWIAAHHGSLSRETRLVVEDRLKRGDLKAVVCSTSLELGIDIGYVDLVAMLGSPKGIAKALQRVGRSGHKLHATSKGRIIVTDRDDLVEALVLVKKARERRLDAVATPANCLDVLAQHLLGMAIDRAWTPDEAFALVRRAGPYRDLPRGDFDRVLSYLAGVDPALEERRVYGKIRFDPVAGTFTKRGRLARAIYSLNIGTIPETTFVRVLAGTRFVGEVDEEFVENLNPGDVFVLGGQSWAFQYARGMAAHVVPAPGRDSTIPLWGGEKLPLTPDLAREVARFRGEVRARLAAGDGRESLLAFLKSEYHASDVTAEVVLRYFTEQARFAAIPAEDEVLVEEYVGDDLARNYIFHHVAGRRANEALARAFARAVSRERGVNVRILVSDNGFVLAVPRPCVLTVTEVKALFFLDVAAELHRALEGSEILKRRFRHVAERALLLLRRYAGRERTVGRQQVNAFILFHVLRRLDPDFPVIKEVYREIMEDAFDVRGAEDLAYRVVTRRARVTLLRHRRAPSPFAFNLVASGFEDAVMVDDRRRMIRDLHERVMDLLADEP